MNNKNKEFKEAIKFFDDESKRGKEYWDEAEKHSEVLLSVGKSVFTGDYIRKDEVEKIIVSADSNLSYLIHRGGINWDKFDDKNLKNDMLKTVGELRALCSRGKELVRCANGENIKK